MDTQGALGSYLIFMIKVLATSGNRSLEERCFRSFEKYVSSCNGREVVIPRMAVIALIRLAYIVHMFVINGADSLMKIYPIFRPSLSCAGSGPPTCLYRS